MRREPTDAEKKLWKLLRSKQLADYKFRRQHPVGPYIADFACIEAKLIIELDGGQHAERTDYDEHRTAVLQQEGWRILRFWNSDVMSNADGVAETVRVALKPRNT